MKERLKRICIITLSVVLILCINAIAFAAEEPPMTELVFAETTNGNIVGYNENGISRFYGIPYAQAKRFRMPEDPEHWEGYKTAMMPGEVAPQNKTAMEVFDFMFYSNEIVENESTMLNLNVFTTNMSGTEEAKPVIFWIHGGGWVSGSSMEKVFYEGAALAEYGDVVFVSANHRLNCLGYLDLSAYGEEYKYSGNVGMADLVKALEWVRDNIAEFGGDPDNVTIIGQSGGGDKVTTLMGMPAARGLFHKAVALSGGSAQMLRTTEQAQAETEEVLQILGITAENIKDIENISFTELYNACSQIGMERVYGPVVDGDYYPTGTYEMSADIPFICGNVMGEMNTNIGDIIFKTYSKEGIESGIIPNITEEDTINRLTASYDGDAELAVQVAEAFKEAYPGHPVAEVLYINNRPIAFGSSYPLAEAMENYGGTVYQYIQAASYPFFGGIVAIHNAGDVPLWFHNVDMIPAWVNSKTSEFKNLQDQMATALCNFARTGDPSSDQLPWEPWTSENGAQMVWDCTNGITSAVRYHHEDILFQLMPAGGSSPF